MVISNQPYTIGGNTMYAQLRIFPITGYASTGAPTITAAVMLLATASAEKEINNISLELTPKVITKTWKADNKEEQDTVKTGYEGTVTFYGIDANALKSISNNITDVNGNTVLESSSEGTPKCVLFYHGKNAKGKKYNCWLYSVEFGEVPFKAAQEEENPESISLSFFAETITYTPSGGSAHAVQGIIVYEGNDGYIPEGTEPTAAGMMLPTYE